MPENWTPVTFDQHVHDANTKGRKSPTHLIMDAWIKGIVKLQVIYYNYVPREAAEELLRAARIMNVDVRIGVEFRSLFRGRFIEMIWAPRGFSGVNDYLKFLDRPKTEEFTRKCRKAANFRRKVVLDILDEFNREGRGRLNAFYSIDLPPVSKEEFLASVQYGQPSIEHIGELLVTLVRRQLLTRLEALEAEKERKSGEESRLSELRARLGALSGELLRARYIDRTRWDLPPAKMDDLPEINRSSPYELITELHKVASGFRMTLNLSGLHLEDVIEILYDCRGEITTLEIFNLKDDVAGERPDDDLINQLRHALNSGSVFKLKNLIRRAINRVTDSDRSDRTGRVEKLRQILRDMSGFLEFYLRAPLDAVIGFSELLQMDGIPREEVLRDLQAVNLAGRTLLAMVNNVFDFTEIETDKLEIQPSPMNLRELLSEIFMIFRQTAEGRNLKLELILPEHMPRVVLDPQRLRQEKESQKRKRKPLPLWRWFFCLPASRAARCVFST